MFCFTGILLDNHLFEQAFEIWMKFLILRFTRMLIPSPLSVLYKMYCQKVLSNHVCILNILFEISYFVF